MIYLISEIGLSLLFAILFGCGLGWLAHRVKAQRAEADLKGTISRQQQQVIEAQTEVSIITNDFDDLKAKNESEIARLQEDNKKMPALSSNLQQSQLLVRQLYQKHELELRQLSDEREALIGKLNKNANVDQEITKLRRELDTERKRVRQLSTEIEKHSGAHPLLSQATTSQKQSNAGEDSPSEPNSRTQEHPGSATPTLDQASASDQISQQKMAEDVAATTAENESRARQIELDTAELEALRDQLSDTDPSVTEPPTTKSGAKKRATTSSLMAAAMAGGAASGLALETSKDNKPKVATTEKAETDTHQDDNSEATKSASNTITAVTSTKVSHPESDARQSWASKRPAQTQAGTTATLNKEPDKIEPLFEPVDQRDDLKQIFGIGPVTEKTLNKLGITSYSQLADLKKHDIEKIANALQIFPARIERDNWVGSARAQLEEVLEDL